MDKFMQIEENNVFIGYGSSPKASISSEDTDFNDVFGGPPRRFSAQEVRVRYSFGETGVPDEEKASTSRSSIAEKPVFGEETGPRGRRHQGGDFFDDIFRGSRSESYGSPRISDHNMFGSSPGSRAMSPSKPLSPNVKSYATSLPTQFSLPATLTKPKPMDLPTFGSNNKTEPSTSPIAQGPHTPSPLSRSYSNKQTVNMGREDKTRYEAQYCRSPLTRGPSFGSQNFPVTTASDAKDDMDKGDKFHFSIYKWADGGVPMLYPLVAGGGGDYNLNLKLNDSTDREIRRKSSDLGRKIEKEVQLKNEQKPLRALLSDDIQQPEAKERKGRNCNGRKTESRKGKVREFVQILNREVDSNPKPDVQRRWKKNEVSSNAEKVASINEEDEKSDISIKVDENLIDKGSREHSSKHVEINVKETFSSVTMLRDDTKVFVEEFDDPLEDSFQVQVLSEDHEKVPQDESSDDTKAIDAKIQQWSFGKKGNIRSLLSTLQYVLWDGSGWKPVPLVDLIESNAVKRAYQKALLRLHPDKLQQKSAAFHHKYIAEKVFDILQEAWDHFNTCSSLNL